jgi:hypothetical protein
MLDAALQSIPTLQWIEALSSAWVRSYG